MNGYYFMCKIENCESKVSRRGFCAKHYKRLLKHGDPLKLLRDKNQGCKVEGCLLEHKAKGYCNSHFSRYRRHGDPLAGGVTKKQGGTLCSLGTCDNNAKCKGYCAKHYQRFKRNGHTEKLDRTPNGAPLEFITSAVRGKFKGCVDWPFALNSNGYGSIWFENRTWPAHKLALTMAKGLAPKKDFVACHKPVICHNPKCINPEHLEWASEKVNASHRKIDGTENKGKRNGMATLDRAKVELINSKLIRGEKVVDIALNFGVSRGCVYSIRSGKSWSWVTGRCASP